MAATKQPNINNILKLCSYKLNLGVFSGLWPPDVLHSIAKLCNLIFTSFVLILLFFISFIYFLFMFLHIYLCCAEYQSEHAESHLKICFDVLWPASQREAITPSGWNCGCYCLLATQDSSDNKMYCALEIEVLIYRPWAFSTMDRGSEELASSGVDTFNVFFFLFLLGEIIFTKFNSGFT